jgi:hypothetical protein
MAFVNATLTLLGVLSISLNNAPWLDSGAVVIRSDPVKTEVSQTVDAEKIKCRIAGNPFKITRSVHGYSAFVPGGSSPALPGFSEHKKSYCDDNHSWAYTGNESLIQCAAECTKLKDKCLCFDHTDATPSPPGPAPTPDAGDAQWYSSDCATFSDPSACAPLLPAEALITSSGTDAIGVYTEQSLAWSTKKGAEPLLVTGVRSYTAMPDVKVLTQSFPAGLKVSNHHRSTDEVISAFPTLKKSHLDLGVLFYEGVQCQNTHFFHWPKGLAWAGQDFKQQGSTKKPNDDGAAMPLLLTATDGSAILMSPLVDFFTSVQTASDAVGNFSVGMQSTVENIPAGHIHQTLLVGGSGVRAATMRWGELLMKASGNKTRSMRWTEEGDVSLRSLSYYTDNVSEPKGRRTLVSTHPRTAACFCRERTTTTKPSTTLARAHHRTVPPVATNAKAMPCRRMGLDTRRRCLISLTTSKRSSCLSLPSSTTRGGTTKGASVA